MSLFKNRLRQYVMLNIHVSLALVSLVLLTYHYTGFSVDWVYVVFAGLGTLVAYTYIKNVPPQASIFVAVKQVLKQSPIWIHFLGLLVLGLASFFNQAQGWALISIVMLCLGYILPGSKALPAPLRDFGAVKIIIVALAWSGVMVLIPLLSFGHRFVDLAALFIAQTLWIIVLTIPFEIRDSSKDQLRHPTWPQKLGLLRVKILGTFLILSNIGIHFWLHLGQYQWLNQSISFVDLPYLLTMGLSFFGLIMAKPKQSFWYSAFWIEAIPIAWLVMICLL